MDLVKIGRYLAAKRKALGLTQRELAEQLGMSDKSVSKWERGVCLPDVSLYEEYCAALGISLHEFLVFAQFLRRIVDLILTREEPQDLLRQNQAGVIYSLPMERFHQHRILF